MLVVERLNLTLQQYSILSDISFAASAPTTIGIVGQSGAGKTTLLRCIAGLESHEGTITFQSQRLDTLPPQQRNIGMVEQHPSLFPQFTIAQNVGYPLRLRHYAHDEIAQRVESLLQRFHIGHCADRKPHEVSGGEQRRAMLARALIYEPQLLLLDEPFSAVDAIVRVDLVRWLKEELQQRAIIALYVTHDVAEARYISSNALVLHEGRLLAYDTWGKIEHHPHPTVHELLHKHF